MFGSAVNGLMSKESDLDLTVVIDDSSLDHQEFLRHIATVLCKKADMIEVDGKKIRRYHVAKDMPRQDNSGWILELKDQKY